MNKTSCRVLITSPDINSGHYIGGIASLTKLLIENNRKVEYVHFVRGKGNYRNRGFLWLMRQPFFLLRFVKQFLRYRDIKIVHINIPLSILSIPRDLFLVLISSCFRKKVITHFHGGEYSQRTRISFFLKSMVFLTLFLSKKIIVLGNKERMFFINYYKVKPNKLHVIPNAVKIPTLLPIKFNKEFNILFLGRIDQNKGLREIIKALKKIKDNIDFRLIVAGDGLDKDCFIEECETFLPGRFKYAGIVIGREKELLLENSHVFLLPSYFEGLPNALLEAMAYRLVPIVTPVGSIPEVVANNKNGLIIPVNDYLAIYDCIIRLYRDQTLMHRLSTNAYNTINDRYSLAEYINQINSIYLVVQRSQLYNEGAHVTKNI